MAVVSTSNSAIESTRRHFGGQTRNDVLSTSKSKCHSFAFVAPRHADGSDWPWLSHVGPFREHTFEATYIENTCNRWPKLTGPYVRWQYLRAMRRTAESDLAFLFSTDIGVGMTAWPSKLFRRPRRVYVGFTQDGHWEAGKISRLGRALRACDAVTVFSEAERSLYLKRYQLDPARLHVIPIHTDELGDYSQYSDTPPQTTPYVLSLGSPNRRFMPIARACAALKIPLIIITRPWHMNDSLAELAGLGATLITDADKYKSLSYLKHAKFVVMAFDDQHLPGAFTTLIHGMFMRTPSVVTDCLGMREYVIDGETGLVVPHGDGEALQSAIEHLWCHPRLADEFAAAGARRAQSLYSLDAAAVAFASLAGNVLGTPNR